MYSQYGWLWHGSLSYHLTVCVSRIIFHVLTKKNSFSYPTQPQFSIYTIDMTCHLLRSFQHQNYLSIAFCKKIVPVGNDRHRQTSMKTGRFKIIVGYTRPPKSIALTQICIINKIPRQLDTSTIARHIVDALTCAQQDGTWRVERTGRHGTTSSDIDNSHYFLAW